MINPIDEYCERYPIEKLKEYRNRTGKTYVFIARKLGISKVWLSLIINYHKPPSKYLLENIEKLINGQRS